jgi:hypothetical protein
MLCAEHKWLPVKIQWSLSRAVGTTVKDSHAELHIQFSNGRHWHFGLVLHMSEKRRDEFPRGMIHFFEHRFCSLLCLSFLSRCVCVRALLNKTVERDPHVSCATSTGYANSIYLYTFVEDITVDVANESNINARCSLHFCALRSRLCKLLDLLSSNHLNDLFSVSITRKKYDRGRTSCLSNVSISTPSSYSMVTTVNRFAYAKPIYGLYVCLWASFVHCAAVQNEVAHGTIFAEGDCMQRYRRVFILSLTIPTMFNGDMRSLLDTKNKQDGGRGRMEERKSKERYSVYISADRVT